jgi:hypothetical protein
MSSFAAMTLLDSSTQLMQPKQGQGAAFKATMGMVALGCSSGKCVLHLLLHSHLASLVALS